MASLTGTKIKDTYDGLLKTSDNGALGASAKQITDGLGTGSPIYLSTSNVGIGTSSVDSGFILETAGNIKSGGNLALGRSGGNYDGIGYNVGFTGTSSNWNYIISDAASLLSFTGGGFIFSGAGSGTSGNAITFQEYMRIDSSGNVGIGGIPDVDFQTEGTYATAYNPDDDFNQDGSGTQIKLLNNDNTAESFAAINFEHGTSQIARTRIVSVRSGGNNSYMSFVTEGSADMKERMRIDSSGDATFYGNVLLSKSAPFISLSNTSEDECGIVMKDSGDVSQSAKITYDAGASNALKFYNNAASERMRITSGGDLLIGTQGIPDGTTYYGAGFIAQSNERRQLRLASNTTSGLDLVQFYNPNGKVGSILTNGSSTIYAISSDYRLKEDWQPMSGALTRIDALKPVNFAWKADGSRVDGFLAHELQEVIPEAVTGEKDAMRDEEYEVSPAVYEDVVHPAQEAVYETIEHPAIAEELDADGNIIVEAQEAWTEQVLVSEAKEEWTEKVLVSEAVMGTRSVPDYQGIDQSKIVPLLVAAIQELKAEVDALKGA